MCNQAVVSITFAKVVVKRRWGLRQESECWHGLANTNFLFKQHPED